MSGQKVPILSTTVIQLDKMSVFELEVRLNLTPSTRFCNDTKVYYFGNAKTHLVNIQKSPYFKGYYCTLESLYHYVDIVKFVKKKEKRDIFTIV